MVELIGKYTNAVIYAETIEPGVYTQVYDIINCPAFAGQKVVCMPDVHMGKSGPCGLVATIGDYVCPEHIGVDIGCSVSMLILDGKVPADKYAELEHRIKKDVPFGFKLNEKVIIDEKDVLVHTVHGATREDNVVKQWLTKERIEELKEEFIERIRKSKNPFSVYVGDTDCYQMPEDELFEPKGGWGVTEGLIRDHAYYEMQHSQSESLFGVGGNKLRPCYFDEVIFGDGLLLIYFTTYDDRPDYWLVRVDSSCADDPSKLDENEILSAIASWLGSYEQGQERDEEMGAAICSNSTPLWGVLIDFKKGVDRNGQPLKPVPHIPFL